MTPFEWIVRADADDETDAAIVAEVLAGAVRDERNNPDEPVEVSARPSARSANLIVPTDRDTEVPVTHASPDYRSTVRETLSRLSDEALRFQDARVAGGIDREELDAEIARRAAAELDAAHDATLCPIHEPGACYEGCPAALGIDEDEGPTPEELRAEADRATLWGAARGTVALARSLHSGDGDPIDDLVLALARSSGGAYALLESVFRLLDSEEELDAEKRLSNWSSYGTETQYAMMRRVARGVVGNANGCRETFADILHATSERAGSVPPVRLAEERHAGLDSISERDSIWSHRRAARAEAIAAGATHDEASDAWTAAMALDHPKAAS